MLEAVGDRCRDLVGAELADIERRAAQRPGAPDRGGGPSPPPPMGRSGHGRRRPAARTPRLGRRPRTAGRIPRPAATCRSRPGLGPGPRRVRSCPRSARVASGCKAECSSHISGSRPTNRVDPNPWVGSQRAGTSGATSPSGPANPCTRAPIAAASSEGRPGRRRRGDGPPGHGAARQGAAGPRRRRDPPRPGSARLGRRRAGQPGRRRSAPLTGPPGRVVGRVVGHQRLGTRQVRW